jgi:Tfp pilus assembly protein PilN
MINLIPDEQKFEISTLRKFYLILNWKILIISFLISLSLISLLVKIFIQSEVKINESFLNEKEKEINLNKNLIEKIEHVNSSLSQIYSFYQNQIIFSEILEKLYQIVPSGISFSNISISFLEKEKAVSVSLSGISPSRDLLLLFKENLGKEKSISEVIFPLDVWIKKENINFSLTFKIK